MMIAQWNVLEVFGFGFGLGFVCGFVALVVLARPGKAKKR